MEIESTDRYGGNYPDSDTMCPGQCEGTGRVPISQDDMEEPWRTLWLQAEKEKPSDDGTHFVKCPLCKGTGYEAAAREVLEILDRELAHQNGTTAQGVMLDRLVRILRRTLPGWDEAGVRELYQ